MGFSWDFDGFWQRTFHNLKKSYSVFTKAFAMTSSTTSLHPLHPPFQGQARAPGVMFVALQSPLTALIYHKLKYQTYKLT
jgi:hypothetical protein